MDSLNGFPSHLSETNSQPPTCDSPSMWTCGKDQDGGPPSTNSSVYGTSNRFQHPQQGTNPSGYYTTGRGSVSSTSSIRNVTSQPQCIPTTSLKVSLPPEETYTGPSPPGIQAQQASLGYGSIPHLEASPRRYRQKDASFDYQYESSATLGIPTFSDPNQVSPEFLQQNYGSIDAPPKLPEKPSKTSSVSPPPLPPKKPLSQQNSWKNNIPPIKDDDIYDFPPDPTIGSELAMSHEETRRCISDILQHSQVSSEHVMLPTGPTTRQSKLNNESQPPCLVTLEELSRMLSLIHI